MGKCEITNRSVPTPINQLKQALLGSLVFGASWADASDSGTVTMVYPVYGATGVYKSAK